MRIVFIGSSSLSEATARTLMEKGHEVIFIEKDRERINELSDNLDCGFIHGDGTRPEILKEADPGGTDVLFCLTNSDQQNIIASLVGRSQGFPRVVTRIEDAEFDTICAELGIQDTIVPTRMTARLLADMAAGYDVLHLSSLFKGDARLYTFRAGQRESGAVSELELPERARVICFYRDGDFQLAGPDSSLRKGDEVVILTDSGGLGRLREKYDPPAEMPDPGEGEKT